MLRRVNISYFSNEHCFQDVLVVDPYSLPYPHTLPQPNSHTLAYPMLSSRHFYLHLVSGFRSRGYPPTRPPTACLFIMRIEARMGGEMARECLCAALR